MSRLVDRRPAAAPLAPRRLLGWVAAAGALLLAGVRESAVQRGLVHPPG
jgi:hypothetical protein